MIADWSEPRTIEVIPTKQLAYIRLTMIYPQSIQGGKHFEAMRIAKAALDYRSVFFQEITTIHGNRVLSIPTLKTGDPIDFLRYALGMPVVLKDRCVPSFSCN